MERTARQSSGRLRAFLIGLVAVAAVLVADRSGLLRRPELWALDERFAAAGNPGGAEDVAGLGRAGGLLHVDIDERSLQRVGRWPWPRARLAAMIDTLRRCGARSVVLDILFSEPQVGPAGLPMPGGEDPPPAAAAGHSPTFDDLLLAEAIASIDTVLPVHLAHAARDDRRARRAREILELWRRGRCGLAYEDVRAALDESGEREQAYAKLPQVEAARAYLLARALRSVAAGTPRVEGVTACGPSQPQRMRGWVRGAVVPPLACLAESARAVGAVSHISDLDGVVRRVPLLVCADSRPACHFALCAAAMALEPDANLWRVSVEPGYVVLAAGPHERRIPVDAAGRMLIRWPGRGDRVEDALHIPASAVLEIDLARRALQSNLARRRRLQLEVLELAGDGTLAALFARAQETAGALAAARWQKWRELLYGPAGQAGPETDLVQAETAAEAAIDRAWRPWRRDHLEGFLLAEVPEAPGARAQARRLRALLAEIDEIDRADARTRTFLAGHLQELRTRVAGRVCLIGSSAAGAPDFVVTPAGANTPGAWLQGWAYRTIVSGRFLRPAPLWLDVLVLVLLGAAAAAMAATMPPTAAVISAIGLGAAWAAVNALWLFAGLGMVVAMVSPLAAGAAGLLAASGYRHLRERRQRQRIRGMFAHALSPQLVDRLIAEPQIARPGGSRREITAMFFDLAGFTTLSEQLGPERTVGLLREVFDAAGGVIRTEGGYVNKFLGDGLFCMFSAPLEQSDHAARALRAAVACRRAVAGLDGDAAVTIRAGVACGEAMVGNCGSSSRMDYTAIGDTVNLASRLEAANKFFSTGILCSQATWSAGGSGLLGRPLGRVRVTGQATAVEIYEVCGAADTAEGELKRGLERFAAAQGALAAGRLSEAETLFREVLRHLPGDRPTEIFLEILELIARGELAPGGSWRPASGKGVEEIVLPASGSG
jgi:adenylate cyclase